MLKVIGAGLPRTGTTSTKAALERLGFGPCHHMFEIFTHPEQAERWLSVLSDTPVDWEMVLAGYSAAQDWPSSHFWRELAAFYPEAKVVLTVRDPSRWLASFRTLLTGRPKLTDDQGEPPAPVAASQRLQPVLDLASRTTFGMDWRSGEELDEDRMVAAYHRHNAAVQAGLPAERLLVFDVRQGWGPLCDFLGVQPPDEPFPHLNDSQFLQENFRRMMTSGELISPFKSASP
jgi:hypothetical protein